MATTRSVTKELIEEGQALGYSGEELQQYVKEEKERLDQKQREEREHQKQKEEREHQKQREEMQAQIEREQRESRERERQRERQHEIELKNMEIKMIQERNEAEITLKDKELSKPTHCHPTNFMNFHLDKFVEGQESIDIYLQKFERMAKEHELPQEKWNLKLSQGLSGSAYDVYTRLPQDQENNYISLKQALLRRFHLNAESYRKEFRAARRVKHESFEQFADRLRVLLHKWTEMAKVNKDWEGLQELVILEQVRETFSPELKIFTAEHGATTLNKTLELADRYVLAHDDEKPKAKNNAPSNAGTQNQDSNGTPKA